MDRERPVEELLERFRGRDPEAERRLFPLLYDELRAIARAHMTAQAAQHTLQPTALVHEACLKLAHGGERAFNDRVHFLRLAAVAMRQVLVDHSRRKSALKRSAPGEALELDGLVVQLEERSADLVLLDAALRRLEERDPKAVRLIELRFFGGCTLAEAAAVLGVTPRQAARWWAASRLLLTEELERG